MAHDTCICTCISVCPYSRGYRVYFLQVKRKKSPVSDDGDDENDMKDDDWEESGDSPDDDDDFKPAAKKSKKSISDGENCLFLSIFKNGHNSTSFSRIQLKLFRQHKEINMYQKM